MNPHVLFEPDRAGQRRSGAEDCREKVKGDGEQELIVGIHDPTAESQPRGKQSLHPEGIWYTACSGIWNT